MQYDNNDLVGRLPKSPHKNLKKLGALLIGKRWLSRQLSHFYC